MSIPRPLTKSESDEVFEDALRQSLTTGQPAIIGQGLGWGTTEALNNVARQYPSASEEIIAAAREAYSIELEPDE